MVRPVFLISGLLVITDLDTDTPTCLKDVLYLANWCERVSSGFAREGILQSSLTVVFCSLLGLLVFLCFLCNS